MAEEQSSLLYPELGENNYLNTGFDGFLRRDTYDLSKEFSLSEQSQLGLGELAGSDILAWGDVYDDGNKPENDADVTASHTAAAISGQGDLATLDTVTASLVVVSGATTLADWRNGTDTTKIDGGDIYTDTVTATQISVTNLAAINADLGTVTAGTITGLTIQTSASANTGIKLDIYGEKVYGQTINFYAASGSTAYGQVYAGVSCFYLMGINGANIIIDAGGGGLNLNSNGTGQIAYNGTNVLLYVTTRPSADNTVDLGTSSYEFKDLYIDGTANLDAIDLHQAPTTGLTADQHVGFACTASFTISLNGVSYKIPCVAA